MNQTPFFVLTYAHPDSADQPKISRHPTREAALAAFQAGIDGEPDGMRDDPDAYQALLDYGIAENTGFDGMALVAIRPGLEADDYDELFTVTKWLNEAPVDVDRILDAIGELQDQYLGHDGFIVSLSLYGGMMAEGGDEDATYTVVPKEA